MLAFVLHKTNKYKKENEEKHYFVFEKQTFLEHFDNEDHLSVISNCLITNYTKPETYNKQILDLYKKYDIKLFTHLKGEFSFGIWDKQKQTFFGGRDRIGVKPFYYYNDDDIFIYSSTLKFIKEYFGFTELNEYWIADALSGIVYDKTSTQFEKIFRMPPAHYMLVSKEKFEIKRYWELKINKIENIGEEEAIAMFREKLFHAVNSRFFPHITGTELSGGLDSSGVTSIAAIRAKETNSKLYSYSQRLADKYLGKIPPYKDEREYSDAVAEMYPNIILRPITAEDRGIIEPMKKVIDIIGAPVSNHLSYLFDVMFETAQKDNVKIILSGYGGDEIVSNSGSYYLKDLAINKKWKLLKKVMNKPFLSKPFIHLFLSKTTPTIINIYRKINNKYSWQREKFNNLFLNNELIKKTNATKRYWKRYYFNPNNSFDNYQLLNFNEHYIQNRLETLGEVSKHYNIEQSHPLLDIELIDTFINLPNKYKYKHSNDRLLFRNSLKNILPLKIGCRKNKTIATEPNHLIRLINDINKIDSNVSFVDNNKYKQLVNNISNQKNNDGVLLGQKNIKTTIFIDIYLK